VRTAEDILMIKPLEKELLDEAIKYYENKRQKLL
jgi:response regulator of citrate/malate metabolism